MNVSLKILLILFLVFPSFLHALPVQHISKNVVVIGTNNPTVGRNVNLEALARLESDFSKGAPSAIANLIQQKERDNMTLTAILPLSFSPPIPPIQTNLPQRSGMITAAVLVFTTQFEHNE